MAEQAVQRAAQQQPSIGAQPAQRSLGRVHAELRRTVRDQRLAGTDAPHGPGEQGHGDLRSVAVAAGFVEVLPVEDAKAFGNLAGLLRAAVGRQVEGAGGRLGH
ncbi:hypothetical protein D3C78_1439400 [compost metagenome]